MTDRTYALTILALTENGVRCSAAEGEAFWLPKAHVTWHRPPETGRKVSATIPNWLALSHRQLVGDEKFEAAKQGRGSGMEKRDNSGTLSKNQNPKSDKSPPYLGSAQIDDQEYWISGWVKEGARGKFFSLSFRRKE